MYAKGTRIYRRCNVSHGFNLLERAQSANRHRFRALRIYDKIRSYSGFSPDWAHASCLQYKARRMICNLKL